MRFFLGSQQIMTSTKVPIGVKMKPNGIYRVLTSTVSNEELTVSVASTLLEYFNRILSVFDVLFDMDAKITNVLKNIYFLIHLFSTRKSLINDNSHNFSGKQIFFSTGVVF